MTGRLRVRSPLGGCQRRVGQRLGKRYLPNRLFSQLRCSFRTESVGQRLGKKTLPNRLFPQVGDVGVPLMCESVGQIHLRQDLLEKSWRYVLNVRLQLQCRLGIRTCRQRFTYSADSGDFAQPDPLRDHRNAAELRRQPVGQVIFAQPLPNRSQPLPNPREERGRTPSPAPAECWEVQSGTDGQCSGRRRSVRRRRQAPTPQDANRPPRHHRAPTIQA